MVAQIVPMLAMMAIGTAINYQAQQQAAARSRRANEAAQMRQLQYRDDASKVIDTALQNWQAPQRQERGNTIEGEIVGRSTEALQHANEQGFGDVRQSIQGNVSSAYDKARATATARTKDSATELARILAKVQTPYRLRTNEGLIMGDTASQLGTLGNFARGTGQADSQLIQRAGQVSPMSTIFGSALTGAGSSGMGGGW